MTFFLIIPRSLPIHGGDFLTDEVLFFTSQIFLINHLLYLYLQTLIKEKLRFYSFLHWKS